MSDLVVPETVKASEMRRNWWVTYIWERVTTFSDPEPVYLRAGLRPIEDSVEAAKQFDEFWRNYQSVIDNIKNTTETLEQLLEAAETLNSQDVPRADRKIEWRV